MPLLRKFLLLALVATASLAACRRDNVRALDATPEVPDHIDFGLLAVNQKAVLPITIENTGQIGLQINDTSVDEPFDVEVPADAVEVGGSADVLIKFQPTQPGEVTGTLTLATSSSALPSVTVKLHGIAFLPALQVTPSRLDFGSVNVGEQKTLAFQVINKAPVLLNPEVEPLEQGSDFDLSPQGSLDLLDPNGGSTTITVSFAPSVAGPIHSAAVVTCPVCAALQVQLDGVGVGAPPPPPPPPPPDAGTPDAGTVDAGTVDAGTPDAGPPDAGPAIECTLTATPQNVDFGKVKPGDSARQVVTLASVGTGPCFLQKPYKGPGTDSSMDAAPLVATTLQPGQSTTFTATFAPVASTPLLPSGSVVVVSNDKVNSPLIVSLSGELDPPPPPPPPPPPGKLVVAPLTLNFTAQVPSAPASQTVAVLNDGGSNLTWTATSNDAKVTLSSASATLAPGGTSSVTVSVAGQSTAGSRTAKLQFDAGSAGSATVTVNIVFTSAPPPPPPPAQLDVTPLSLVFKAVAGTAPPAQSITATNLGGVGLTWTGSVNDSGVHFTPASGSLAAGAAQLISVSVDLGAFAGKRSAVLGIDAGAAGHKDVAISIEFTAPPPPPPPPQYGGSAWPKWHHDNASSGLSHVDTSTNKGAIKWKTFVSAPVPCITDGRTDLKTRCGTYVNSPVLTEDGSIIQLGGDGLVYQFDRATGKKKWSVETAPPWIAANEGTPTVVKDGSIFQMTAGESFSKPQFYKLSKDGKITWNNTPGGTCGTKKCDGWDSSPALGDDGTLYTANDDIGTIQAYDQTGRRVGEVDLDPKSDLETQSAALDADNIGYFSGNGHVWALTAKKQLWSFTDPIAAKTPDFNPPAYFHNIKSSPALTPDGKVIWTYVFETTKGGVTQQTTRVYAFAAGKTLKQLWVSNLGPTTPKEGLPPGPGLASDYADALHYRSGITSPAVGPDGTIYVGHCDGLFALNPDTGKFKWGVGTSEVVSSPAVGKDGTIYFGSMDGKLYAVKPDGSVKWQVKTNGQLNSSPAIGADGTVYVTSDDGYLYAIH